MLVEAVQRLPQHELAAVCVVAYVQPVRDSAPRAGNRLMNLRSCGSGVYAADDQIEIIAQVVVRIDVLWNCFPVEAPEQVQPIDKDYGLEQPYLARRERLTDAISRRNPITVDDGYRQA